MIRIGGDQELTTAGDNYAHALAAWIEETVPAVCSSLLPLSLFFLPLFFIIIIY